jgi:hypothetical protein
MCKKEQLDRSADDIIVAFRRTEIFIKVAYC